MSDLKWSFHKREHHIAKKFTLYWIVHFIELWENNIKYDSLINSFYFSPMSHFYTP